jgi:hypothetical protein
VPQLKEECASHSGTPQVFWRLDDHREQDTVDVLPYFIHDDKLYIVITESLKPALLLRPQVAKSIEGIAEDNNNGYILEQPSAVILTKKSEYSISDAINRIFKEKLPGLTPLSPPSILGGSYFPSVGTSTEIVFPRAVRVKPDISYFYTIPYAKAYVIEAQEVCTLYFEHKREVSTRLIELIYRLADDISYKISAPLTKGEQINYSFDSIFRKERFVDKATVRNLIEAPSLKDSTVARVVVSETEKPRVPFLHTTRFRTECIKTDGTSGTSEVDVLVRKNVDSIDVGGYFLCEGKAYMPIKWGVRPALSVRNLMPHPIHTDTSVYFIEGVAGSFEGESTKADLLNRGIIETEEEVSLTNSGTAIYIGYDYPSPGHNIERVYRMLLSLDPTREVLRQRDEEETLRIVYVSVEDIIELAHEGTIRDLRLSLNAHCVQSLLQDTEYKIRPYERKKEDQLFEELVNQPSDVQKWLSENSGQVDEILSESSLYRKLKSYGESELGVAVMELHHEKESSFFSPMVPLFAIPDTNQKDKIPFYYLHDLFHYATTGFVPLVKTDNSGELSICSFEEYMKAVAGNECEAVWYSDVLIPEEFGIDRAEQIFNGDSVARAFAELGIEKSESREIIREIELYGRIPEEVRTHQLFGRFKNVFIGRLLRYHVMDTDNSKSMYAYWAEHLDIAKVMEDFCDVFSSVEEYEK